MVENEYASISLRLSEYRSKGNEGKGLYPSRSSLIAVSDKLLEAFKHEDVASLLPILANSFIDLAPELETVVIEIGI
jgi:hypothetical protein